MIAKTSCIVMRKRYWKVNQSSKLATFRGKSGRKLNREQLELKWNKRRSI